MLRRTWARTVLGVSVTAVVIGAGITHLGGLSVKRNPYLDAGAGLDALTTVDTLVFEDNPALTTFAGLPALESVGYLLIAKNAARTSLASFSFLKRVDGPLTITNNKALHTADILAWVAGLSIGGRTKFDGNADDAPHVTECPWAGDGECDAESGFDLCPYALDVVDCCWEGPC